MPVLRSLLRRSIVGVRLNVQEVDGLVCMKKSYIPLGLEYDLVKDVLERAFVA